VRLDVDDSGIPSIGTPTASGAGSIVRVDLENPGGTAPRGESAARHRHRQTRNARIVFKFRQPLVSMLDLSNRDEPKVIRHGALFRTSASRLG
jgi:hypothetical protein